jgi:hypothetical protein
MSREFGSCESGYFHYQIETAAFDCKQGRDALTRMWGLFLGEFVPVAYAISTSEARDAGPDFAIVTTKKHLAAMRHRLDNIEKYLSLLKEAEALANERS